MELDKVSLELDKVFPKSKDYARVLLRSLDTLNGNSTLLTKQCHFKQ